MKIPKKIVACIFAFGAFTPSQAHEVWLERGTGDNILIKLAELPEPEPNGGAIILDDLKGVKFIGHTASIVRRPDHLEASIKDKKDIRLEAYYKPWQLPDGTHEGALFWARYGRTDTSPKMDFEIVPTRPNGNSFKAILKGKTLTGKIFHVINPDHSWKELTTGADGVIEAPITSPGRYIVMAYHLKEGADVVEGQAVTKIWYGVTTSFVVP